MAQLTEQAIRLLLSQKYTTVHRLGGRSSSVQPVYESRGSDGTVYLAPATAPGALPCADGGLVDFRFDSTQSILSRCGGVAFTVGLATAPAVAASVRTFSQRLY